MRRGINRPDIEAHLNEAVVRLTGLPDDRVFFSEYADDTVAPPRPCVSMTLMPYETEQKQGTVFYTPSLELWRLIIESDADADYTATIDGTTYSYTALGETMTEIRDGLAAAIAAGADPDHTSVAAATRSIDITSEVPGKLLVVSGSTGVSATRLRSDVLKTVSRAVQLRLELQCVGEYSSPSNVALTGVDIAERLQYALMDPDETTAMRDAGHHIVLVRATDARRIIDGKAETIGVIDAVLNTTSLHVGTTVGSGRSASVTVTERTI